MSEADRIKINRALRNRFSMLAQPEPTREQLKEFEKSFQRYKEIREKLISISEVGLDDLDNDSAEWLREQLGININNK